LKEKNIKVIWPNNKETFVSEGDDWFSSAKKAGLEIPTGCLTCSCGACEIDVNGETVRACISEIKNNKNIFVEAESANIGKCKIPHEFFNQMKTSRRIEILRSESNRLDELIDTYSVFKKEELQESVIRIKKRLGPQRTKIALESINSEKWDLVCRAVLDYYDKCYEYEKVGKTNIKILDLTDKKYDESILELINNVL